MMMTTMTAATAKVMTMTDAIDHDVRHIDTGAPGRVRVWDAVIRMFHWALVATVALAWASAEELSRIHELSGYAVAGLVAIRLVWGLLGSRYARFSQFVRPPRATLAYLRDMLRGQERRYLGHNPAGAVMVLSLLATLSCVAGTGWLMDAPDRLAMVPSILAPAWTDEVDAHRAYGEHAESMRETLEEAHEVFANMLLLLVALHVGGVMLASARHRENLAGAMVTGDKRAPVSDDIT
ncbi:MAG: cytochrome b/b6 domain-containing protein [Roseovarius sp.]|jgi:cytochrome b